MHAFPLRLRDTIIGALNLFKTQPGQMPAADIQLTQALADVASVAILQDQAARVTRVRDLQLQNALDSRVVIEQAKGMVSERAGIDMAAAFNLIRNHARSNNLQLTGVAEQVVAGTIVLDTLRTPRTTTSGSRG